MCTSPDTERRIEGRFFAIAATILAVALLEWGLFELLRMPYRPPHDMSTLLGTEKYTLRDLMIAIALAGGGVVTYLLMTSTLSLREYLGVTSVISLVVGLGAVVVRFPAWPVTPWELLWQ